jgi:DEP domain-containing protein 5
MKSSHGGLNFLDKSNNLPSFTFVSYEAISWLLEHVDGISNEKEAVELMQKMTDEKLICHASGNSRFQLLFHFFLFELPE